MSKQSQNQWYFDIIEKITIFISLLIYSILFPPFFKNQVLAGHDIGSHLNYLRIFTDALSQGQFPVRWIEWGSLGQNQPLFTFYQPLLYYLGTIPHLLGFDILNSLNITILVLWLLSGFTMYLLVKNLSGNTLAGFAASSVYVFAPYHILDVFVRSAYPEVTALAFVPALFWALERYFATEKRLYIGFLALLFAAVFTSHPPTLIIFSFPFLIFTTYLLRKDYKNNLIFKKLQKKAISLLLGLSLGVGLSSFFVIPAFLQQNLINSPGLNAGYLDFHNHFACTMQLLWSNWDYGTSVQGCLDQMSFQVGIINWLIILTSFGILIYYFKKKIKNENFFLSLVLLFTAFWGMYMTLSFSEPFWAGIPYLSFIQFPWRFLSVTIFATALLSGLLFTYVQKPTMQIALYIIIIIAAPFFVFSYLQPGTYLPKDYFAQDSPNFYQGVAAVQKNDTAELGYMPKDARVLPIPSEIPASEIKPLDSNADIAVIKNNFTYKEYVLNLERDSRIIIYVHYFPGWTFTINGNKVKPDYSNVYGLVYLNALAGENRIVASFINTPIVTISNLISLISLIILVILMLSSIDRFKFSGKLPTTREEI